MTKIFSKETAEEAVEYQRMKAFMTPQKKDQTSFNEACQKFRDVCATIKEEFRLDDFKGGFDEMDALLHDDTIDKSRLTQHYMKWSVANSELQYQAGRLNIKSPDLWYMCWGIPKPEDENLASEKGDDEQ